ncbi:hypothetical protein GCM10022237_43180 [Nocardioides ginsengisoli]|uniref:DUF2306 domain-containing protein n=1 Tax=Nocardioides ginsengisoli TaxID=363868 RepID=A0ABW3VV96_9ACTN
MVRRVVLGMLALLVVGYVPLAATSMWFTVLPGFPRWQEDLDAWLGGHAYAWGSGSVAAVRTAAYVDHRVALLVHTTLGAVALCLLLAQALLLRRGGGPGSLHRRLGWAYVGAVVVSMLASFVFLLRAPHLAVPGQTGFRLQLWLLGLSTLGTVVLGVLASRRGDREAHRAWLTLSACFLLTAPLLRLLWSTLGALVPGHTMLTNLEVSAVALAVVAPGTGAALHAWTSSPVARGGRSGRGVLLPVAVVGVVGEAVVLLRFAALDGPATPALYPWFHVVPMLVFGLVIARGRPAAWARLGVALAVVPWAVLVVALALEPWLGTAESLRAGLMCGPGFPLVASVGVALAARRSDDRPGAGYCARMEQSNREQGRGEISEVDNLGDGGEIEPGDSVAGHPHDRDVQEGATGPDARTGDQDQDRDQDRTRR